MKAEMKTDRTKVYASMYETQLTVDEMSVENLIKVVAGSCGLKHRRELCEPPMHK